VLLNSERLAFCYRGIVTLTQKHQSELSKISEGLQKALTAQPEECHRIIEQVIRRVQRLSESIASAPAKLGSKGGKKTAERGPDYFRQLAAKRKTRAGGRPAKSA
jgi:hypothetical protein